MTQWVREQGIATASFRDPGTTVIGEKVREILLSPAHDAMTTSTEVLLYMAARAQLWAEEIAPALEQGQCVLLDRWLSSTCAYQGYAGGFGINRVVAIAADSLERAWPDLTIILDVDQDTAAGRLNRELDRMEQKGADYHARVREGFLKLARTREDFIVVDATQSPEAVHRSVLEVVMGAVQCH